MTNQSINFRKLIWKVPAFVLLLIVLGNITMLVALNGQRITWPMFLYGSLNSVLIGGSFALGLSSMIRILDRRLPWLSFPAKRLFVQVILTIVFSLVMVVITVFLSGFLIHQEINSDYFVVQGIFMLKVAFTFIFIGTLGSNAILFFKNWKEAAVQQEKLKREQLALQYETLKSQVNPHFLFNNLNALTALISTNPEKAIDFVKKLSEVYRYVLDQKDHELVDLGTELNFLESYVYLQKIRFETNLDVQIDVNPKSFKIIPLSLQMLVENDIKHNEVSDKRPLHIRIYSDDEQYLTVEINLKKKYG